MASQEYERRMRRDSKSPIEDGTDLLRVLEYPQLVGKTYLDHAGTTLWAKSLVTDFAKLMSENLYGNPHSESDPSKLSDQKVEAARLKALEFFNASPEDWDLVFTPNSTGAIKLVHDCFRDHAVETGRDWWYGYHKDSHTSLVGVREGTRMHRCFKSDGEVENWISFRGLGGAVSARDVQLFAYPAQSNMTGKRFPLKWAESVRKNVRGEIYTLLDAAAYASTAQLDLSNAETAPDFVALSFYKIFGFPNLGALLVRKASSKILQSRKYFGGGTVEMVISVDDSWSSKRGAIHSRLEDGTLPFTSIFALDLAIDKHRELYGPAPMKCISSHTSRLIRSLYEDLVALRHSNGKPVIQVHNDHGSKNPAFGDPQLQGGTLAFSILKSVGGSVSFLEVEKEANKQGIFLRTGSLCNPGGLATHLQWTPAELREAYEYGHRCSDPQSDFKGKPIGVVRASIGAMTNDEDIQTLVRFVERTYIDRAYACDSRIVLPELEDSPSRLRSILKGDEQKQEMSGSVLHVSEQAVWNQKRKTFKQVGLLPPAPSTDDSSSDGDNVRNSFSRMSSGFRTSRLKAKCKSLVGMMQPRTTVQHCV